MTDRELLQLAAKAAGIDLCWNDAEAPGYYSDFRGLPQWEYWNPLTDDGDALRLAVKLSLKGHHLNLFLHDDDAALYGPDGSVVHKYLDDAGSAVRRCIVHVAAEIGRSMP